MEGMPRTARVVTWNGRDVPAELRELPAGRYVVEAIDDDAPALSPDEEAGIEVALESYRQGRIVAVRRYQLAGDWLQRTVQPLLAKPS